MKNKSNFDWFDLSQYDALEAFDLEDWYFQLNKRLVIKMFGKENPETKKRVGEQRWEGINSQTKKYIASIKNKPFFRHEKKNRFLLSVRDADYFDLHMASYNNNSLKNIFNLPGDEFLGGVGKTLIIDQANSSSPFDQMMLTIDLGATDEQLNRDFKEWLSKQRKISEYDIREKKFTSKDSEKWIKNKILPYIDLTLIAACEDEHLTQNKLGKMLFIEEYDVDLTERIRRSVKPIAESLLNVKTMEALNIQVRAT